MQTETLEIREKTTTEIQMTLYSDDEVINLTGIDHIRLDLRDDQGTVYRFSSDDESPQTRVITAASGIVGWTPASGDLIHSRSPYRGYWWIFPTSSTNYSVPESNEFILYIRPEF